MRPQRLYRILAVAETVTWTLLLIGMALKYLTHTTELGVRIGGGLHGFVFLAYCAATVVVAVDGRWSPSRVAAGLGSAVIPYLTVPFERSAERAGLLADRWRLRSEPPRGLTEALVGRALHQPLAAAALALVLLVLIFGGLLMLGPPTEWGA